MSLSARLDLAVVVCVLVREVREVHLRIPPREGAFRLPLAPGSRGARRGLRRGRRTVPWAAAITAPDSFPPSRASPSQPILSSIS